MEYNSSALNGKLTILPKPDVIPDIAVKNPPNCIVLDNWVFENFILADEPFAKVLRMFENPLSVNGNLCGKKNFFFR